MFKNLRSLMSISQPSPRKRSALNLKHSFERLEPRKMLATVSVFAAGDTGDESFNLIINNQLVETFHDVGGDTQARDFQKFDFFADGPVSADQVQVEFINDLNNGDYDRNLFVDRIVVDGQTFQTEANTTKTTGFIKDDGNFSGEGFFETEILNVDGTFSLLQDNGPQRTGTRIRIDAQGDTGEENLQVQIKGETVKNFRFTDQRSDKVETFQFIVDDIVAIEDISIRFTNDFFDAHTDRNLTVFSYQAIDLESGSREIARTSDGNVFSTGVFTVADGIKPGFGRGNTLSANGFFEVREGTNQSVKTRLRIDASGSTGDEVMEVRLGNTLLGRFEVSQTRQAYFVDVDSNFNLNNIQIAFVNDAFDDQGYDRNLTVYAFQKINLATTQREIARPTDANVFSSGTFQDDDGIAPGFGRGNTLNANGFFQIREVDNSYSLERQIAGDAYFIKTDSYTGNFVAVSGTPIDNLFGHRITLFDSGGNRVSSFGTDGTVQWKDVADAGGFGFTRIEDIDFTEDGSIIVTAHRIPESGRSLAYMIKLLSNGEVDSSFALNGLNRTTPVGFTVGILPTNLVTLIGSDGSITLIGTAANSGNSVALSRYDEHGILDTTFRNNGNVTISGETLSGTALGNNARVSLIGAVKLEDNSVLLVSEISDSDLRVTVLKLNHLGVIDRSYGDNGLATVDKPVFRFSPTGVHVDSQNRLVLTASNAVTRLNSDGSTDTSFGDNGTALLPEAPDQDAAFFVDSRPLSILLDSQDRIVIASNRTEVLSRRGPSVNDGSYIYRLGSDGSLDDTFGDDGFQYFEQFRFGTATAFVDTPFLAALDGDDNLVINVGDSGGSGLGNFSLSRFLLS